MKLDKAHKQAIKNTFNFALGIVLFSFYAVGITTLATEYSYWFLWLLLIPFMSMFYIMELYGLQAIEKKKLRKKKYK